jgi:hypothetical protein
MKIEKSEGGTELIWLDDCEVGEWSFRSLEDPAMLDRLAELVAKWDLVDLV